jgi:hypothetical protein
MHLITIASLDDINLIREACKKRFSQWTFTVKKTELGECLEAEWIPQERLSKRSRRKTHLTVAESNIMFNLLPAFAQAFYDGLCKGRETKV